MYIGKKCPGSTKLGNLLELLKLSKKTGEKTKKKLTISAHKPKKLQK